MSIDKKAHALLCTHQGRLERSESEDDDDDGTRRAAWVDMREDVRKYIWAAGAGEIQPIEIKFIDPLECTLSISIAAAAAATSSWSLNCNLQDLATSGWAQLNVKEYYITSSPPCMKASPWIVQTMKGAREKNETTAQSLCTKWSLNFLLLSLLPPSCESAPGSSKAKQLPPRIIIIKIRQNCE